MPSSFLDKVGNLAGSIKNKVGKIADKIDDAVDIDIIIDDETLMEAASDCHVHARETSRLCEETVVKAREMVKLGMDIRSTLGSYTGEGGEADESREGEEDVDEEEGEDEEDGDGPRPRKVRGPSPSSIPRPPGDASVLELIRDLVSGRKVQDAIEIARELDTLSSSCIEHSVSMIRAMELGVDALHMDWVDEKLKAAKERNYDVRGVDDDDDEDDGGLDVPEVEDDIREITDRIAEAKSANLFTAVDVGIDSFRCLASKSELCREMFWAIRSFSRDVVAVSDSVRSFKARDVVGQIRKLIKDIWRCLRLSSLINKFAQDVGRLVAMIVDLFREASKRLGTIWGALAKAKDCIVGCVGRITDAVRFCDSAERTSEDLIESAGTIERHLENMKHVNKSSLVSARTLMNGEDIRRAIDLASTIDDALKDAAGSIVDMVRAVSDEFDNLPDVIKDGCVPSDADADEAGKKDDDPDPVDVESDVRDLDRSREVIEEADALSILRASREGFADVQSKVGRCRDMIQSSRGFATDCRGTIDSFLGSWDLRAAADKVLEMCRLVHLGKMIRQVADEIMKLVRANIALMKAAKEKIKAMTNVDDIIDDVKDLGKKMAFWKK